MVTTRRFVKRTVLLSLMSLLCGAEAHAAAGHINPSIVSAQEHSNWCWAAASQAVLKAYGKNVSQCDIANWLKNSSDCCGSTQYVWVRDDVGALHPCNTTAWAFGDPAGNRTIADVLSHWGVATAPGRRGPLTKTEIASSIDYGRPIIMGWSTSPCTNGTFSLGVGWRWCAGHFLVVDGYEDGGNLVWYMDPYSGDDSLVLYTWLVGGAPNDHDHVWDNSLWPTTGNAMESALIVPIVNMLLE